jgi:hypothetical protein
MRLDALECAGQVMVGWVMPASGSIPVPATIDASWRARTLLLARLGKNLLPQQELNLRVFCCNTP